MPNQKSCREEPANATQVFPVLDGIYCRSSRASLLTLPSINGDNSDSAGPWPIWPDMVVLWWCLLVRHLVSLALSLTLRPTSVYPRYIHRSRSETTSVPSVSHQPQPLMSFRVHLMRSRRRRSCLALRGRTLLVAVHGPLPHEYRAVPECTQLESRTGALRLVSGNRLIR